jgi:hypothetical protein
MARSIASGHGAQQRDGAHRPQILDGEVQAHAKHQQDHADFGQLIGEPGVGRKARCERADSDTR